MHKSFINSLVTLTFGSVLLPSNFALAASNPMLLPMINAQSPVKAEQNLGSCSLFSVTALLEYKLMQLDPAHKPVDLSEQWLSQQSTAPTKKAPNGIRAIGNASSIVMQAYDDNGFVSEATVPFAASETVSPELMARAQVEAERTRVYKISSRTIPASKTSAVEAILDHEPMVLDIDFFYEPWTQHRPGNIFVREIATYLNGVVSYPDPRTDDYVFVTTNETIRRHSVLVVGYDNDKEIRRTVKDVNGNMIEIVTRGVYYFKNSWGTQFGSRFEVDGERHPGFGMLPIKYASEHGTFYSMSVRAR